MGWELVKDTENIKCWLNLDEIKKYKKRNDWKNSINKKIGIRFQWHDEDEEDWFIIVGYSKPLLTIINEDKKEFNIRISVLHKGNVGKLFNKTMIDFRYNIGDEINGLKIINMKHKKRNKRDTYDKYYQYQCLKCGNVDWINEYNLKAKKGCNVCGKISKKVLKGVNDIATTHPYLCKYFVNQEDIYKYSYNSNKIVLFRCPKCGCRKKMPIYSLANQGYCCNKCSDGKSYSSKFMANVLFQLGIKFETEYRIKGYNQYFYDFYIPTINTLIETDGRQHFVDAFGDKVEKQQQIDHIKDDNASNNEFNLIRIDCRYSTMEWMKENIRKELGHLFDLSNIDWQKADLESQKSYMILACKLKRENPDLSTTQIVELIKKEIGVEYSVATIRNWLNRGNELELCYYNGKEEQIRHNSIKVIQIHPSTKQDIKIWNNAKEISVELGFNYSTLKSHINGKQKGKPYKGYIWEYVD